MTSPTSNAVALVERLRETIQLTGVHDIEPWISVIAQQRVEAADLIQSQAARIAELEDKLRRAGNDLEEAQEMVSGWAAYADPYFQEKHDLQSDLARLGIAKFEARSLLSEEVRP